MMSKFNSTFLLTALLSFSVATADQKPYIISGFDDVLRQAENTGLIKSALKILEDDKGFTGMPELYHAISKNEVVPKFVIVSAISNWFDIRIEKFLAASNYPQHQRYLRNWLTEWSIESFKMKNITEIINAKPNRNFIFVFDNSDASIEISEKIMQQFSKQVVAIYLRKVQNKKVPSVVFEFYTAFDIALHEFESGRLSKEHVLKVGQALVNERNLESIIPDYAICPLNYEPCCNRSLAIKDICIKVRLHLQLHCKQRANSDHTRK